MDLFDLVATLTLDTSQYDKGLDDSEEKGNSFGSKLGKAAKVGVIGMAALTTATVAVGTALTKSVSKVADYGDHVDKMSQKIGMSAESYQKWDYVMKRAGGNVDQLKMGMKTLSQQAEKNSDAFQKLGISQEEVASLSKEDLFQKTVEGLASMEEGTERTALASQLLGRAGADMAPLLNQGSDAIKEQMDIAEKYGMVMPDAAVKASAAFNDSVTTMQMTATGLKNRLLGEFLPAFTKVTDGIALLFTGDISGLDKVTEGVNDIIRKVQTMLPKVFEIGGAIIGDLVKGVIEKLPSLASTGFDVIMSLVGGITENLSDLIPAAIDAIVTLVETLESNSGDMAEGAISLIKSLAKGLIKAIPILIQAAPQIIKSLLKTILNMAGEFLSAGLDLIKSLGSGLIQGFADIPSKVQEKLDAIKEKITGWINTIKGFFPISLGKIFSGWFNLPSVSFKKTEDGGATGTSSNRQVQMAKAVSKPYVFKRQTMFMAGEAGDEVLYGRNALLKDIAEATGGGNQIINYISIYDATNAEEVANVLVSRLQLQMRSA